MEHNIGDSKPFGKRVLVAKPEKKEQDDFKKVGNIFIPQIVDNKDFDENRGVIVALGTDLDDSALKVLSIGTEITFCNPHELSFEGKSYFVIHEDNIEMVVTRPPSE